METSLPIENYGVVKGRAVTRALDRNRHRPHYHLLVETGDAEFHVAVNVRSAVEGAELLYWIDEDLQHPATDLWEQFPSGFTPLDHEPTSGAIDYIRGQIVDRRQFRVATRPRRGAGGLPDLIEVHANRAISDPEVVIYAFGSRWGPKPRETDRTFRGRPIRPSDGIHNVHMNQGNRDLPGRRDDHFVAESGPWQDGALLIHDRREETWAGLFFAFQSQEWHSDDASGQPVVRPGRPVDDFAVAIVAALVNPRGPAPERETVTLLNRMRRPVNLDGWSLINTERERTKLSGTIAPGESITVDVSPDAPLGNRGGTIGLLDADGLKVDGVAYTARQASHEGDVLTFTRR
jgi:uncharacterized protein YukJ